MSGQTGNSELKWDLLVADAWADPKLRQRLLENPQAVLQERGITPPEGAEFRVVQDTENVIHLVLPAAGQQGELSWGELAGVAGGSWPPPPPPFPPFPPFRPRPPYPFFPPFRPRPPYPFFPGMFPPPPPPPPRWW